MATRLPDVRVSRVEAHNGYIVTCTGCPRVRTILRTRPQADHFAANHRAAHQTPEPTEEGDWL